MKSLYTWDKRFSVRMGQKVQCQMCDYEASWKSNIRKHQKSVHTDWKNHYKATWKGNFAHPIPQGFSSQGGEFL